MVKMSAKFDEEAHNGLVSIVFTSVFPYKSIVILTFDLWLPKSICTLANMSAKFDKETHNDLVSFLDTSLFPYVDFDLDLWPFTSQINGVHPLVIVNMSEKFDEEAHKGLVSFVFTRSKRDGRTEPQQCYTVPNRNVLRGDNETSFFYGLNMLWGYCYAASSLTSSAFQVMLHIVAHCFLADCKAIF